MSNVEELLASLRETPDHPETVASLERELALDEAWEAYAEHMPDAARGLTDTVEKVRFLVRAAHVCRHYASNAELADTLLCDAVEGIDDEDDDASIAAEDLVSAVTLAFASHTDWNGFVASCIDLSDLVESSLHRSHLMFAMGKAYEDKLYDPERAIHCYQKAFKLNPRVTEPLHRARQIYAHADQWATVVKLYTIELKVVREGTERGRLLKELGHVHMERMGDRDAAIAAFEEAIEADDVYSHLADIIENLRSGTGAHGVVIDPSLETSTPPGNEHEVTEIQTLEDEVELRPVTQEVSRVRPSEDDADEDETTEDTAETVAEDAAEEAVAEDAAEEAAAEDDAEAAAAEDEAEDTAAEDEAEEAAAEEAAADADAEEPSDSETVDGADEAAAAAEETPAKSARAKGAAPAIEAEPMSAIDAGEAMSAYVEGLREASMESGADADVALRWAVEFGLRGGEAESEVASWFADAVVTSEDGLETVRVALPAALGQRAFWEACVEALGERDEEAAQAALFGVHFWALQDIESAEAYVPAAGAYAARQMAVIELAQKGNWRKTQQGLQDANDGDETAAYRQQVTLALGFGKADKAADSLRRVLRKDKNDPDALPYHRALNRHLERWNPYADALKRLAAATTDEVLLQVLYGESVALYRTHIEQPAALVQALQKLSEVEPDNLEVIDELCERLEALNNFRDLAKVLRRKADAVGSDAERLAVLEELAVLFVEKFNNQAEALSVFEQIRELDPDNAEALAQLETLYERRREWEKLIAIKRTLVEQTDDAARQASLMRDAAGVAATRMRDNALAESLWMEVLAFEPGDAESLTSLERLHERAKDWAKLADVLALRVDALSEDAERAPVLLKLGQIRGDRLSDTLGAVEAYEALLEIEPDDVRAKDAVRKAYVQLEDWDRLEAFYRRDGAWAEYVRQIESVAGNHDDTSVRVQLLFRSATTWREELGDEGRATKALEKVLALDEGNTEAAKALVPVYEARGDAKRLPSVLEIVLSTEDDASARFELQAKLARLAADRGKDHEAALNWFTSALGECAHRTDICDELETSASETGAWSSVEAAYTEAREVLEGEGERDAEWMDISLRLGRVYKDQLSDDGQALAVFDDVLGRDDTNATALDAKDTIFTRLSDWNSLLEVLEIKTLAASTEAERVELYARASGIHEEHREDLEAAIEGYREILAIDPAHEGALSALHRLYKQTGDASALAEILGTLIDLHEGDVGPRREHQLALAQVAAEELGEYALAVETLQSVVEGDPGNPAARALLETLLDEESQRLSVSLLLEPLYEADGAWAELVEMLEIQLGETHEAGAQTALLTRIGETHEARLQDGASSMEAYARLLRIAPGEMSARERFETLAEGASAWGAVAALYEELVDDLADGDDASRALAVEFGTRAAETFDARLGQVDEAVRLQRRVLEVEPGRLETLATLDELFTRAGRWEDLLQVCEERLALVDDADERRRLYFKAASIHRDMLDDAPAAIEAYRNVLSAAPDDAEALEALDELYGVTSDAASRAEVIEHRVSLAEPDSPAQLALKDRLARVYDAELGDVARALALWADVLRVDSTNAAAIAGLEAKLDEDDYAMAASETLEPLYIEQGEPDPLVRLLEIQLRHVQEPSERRTLSVSYTHLTLPTICSV